MAETIDYAPLLPKEPPEELRRWVLGQGGFSKEYLIYKAGWEYKPLEGRNVRAVEVTCTACNRSFLADKIDAEGCGRGYSSAPFGWYSPTTTEPVISGSHTLCPFCGAAAEARHVGAMRNLIDDYSYTTVVSRVSVPGARDRLALLDWRTERRIGKDGLSRFSHHLWTAWVVEERRIIRLMGHMRTLSTIAPIALSQRKGFLDNYGKYELIYPWDPAILEGSTAENCKLDLFVEQGGAHLAAYLALWRKRPAVENLVVQGYGRLVEELIRRDQARTVYERSKGIPKLACVNWKEKKPHRMLGMSKGEFRQMAGAMTASDYELVSWARGSGLEVRLPEDLAPLRRVGTYTGDRILKLVSGGQFWRAVRYLEAQNRTFDALRDYWSMAAELGLDLENGQLRWPKDLMAAHDRVMEQCRARENEKLAAAFASRLKELEQYAWSDGGVLIRPCASQKELRQEGDALHHCVARYAGDHAAGKTAILFIRRAEAPEEPWYTLELDEKALVVRQNRGKRNCGKTEEVQAFEDKWLAWVKERRTNKSRKKRSKGAEAV